MNGFIRVISMLLIGWVFMLNLTACEREDPIPEQNDPIFKDLEKKFTTYSKEAQDNQAKIGELQITLSKTEPNSIDMKDIQRDLAKTEHFKLDNQQWATYFRIRMERRRHLSRIQYKSARAKHEPWPDPVEYSEYLVNRRLQEASRNWSRRVPRLQDRTPAQKTKPTSKEE